MLFFFIDWNFDPVNLGLERTEVEGISIFQYFFGSLWIILDFSGCQSLPCAHTWIFFRSVLSGNQLKSLLIN